MEKLVYFVLCASIAFHIVYIYKGSIVDKTLTQRAIKNVLVSNRALQVFLLLFWLVLVFGPTFGIGQYWLLGIIFLVVGQFLNAMVYYRIGIDGVYYGREYGIVNDPYCTKFPFTIPHPMYVGCILTIVGLFVLVGFNEDGSIRMCVANLMILMTLEIIASLYVECKYIDSG